MSNKDKCRVCLADKATYPIFEDIENKDSIHSKLFQCLREKIEDLEGYPRKICDSCMNALDTVQQFITKYKASCKLLDSGLIIVKKEIHSNDESEVEFMDDKVEIEICKTEPDSDSYETLENIIESLPLAQVKQKMTRSFNDIKAKLKNLKEINIKRNLVRKNRRKTSKVVSSILEEFDWNGESLKSNKSKEAKVTKQKVRVHDTKLVLSQIPKDPKPPTLKLCDICGEVFKTSEKLSLHRKSKHLNQQAKCPECPRILNSDYNLKRHLKRTHRKKVLMCDTCGRSFAFKAELNKHVKVVHLGIKPKKKMFKCKLCDKTYVVAKSLLIHERSAHTGVRPAECDVCGSCFFHEDYLKEHMRLHTGEAPFKCPICGRGYAQRGNMRSHISHNHRLADLDEEALSKIKPSLLKYLKKT